MNGDWANIEPLFGVMKASEPAFMFYMIVSSWALLSILMAVVSENLLNACDTVRASDEEKEAERKTARSRIKLKELFERMDIDESGDLKRREFDKVIEDPNIAFELLDAADLDQEGELSKELTLSRMFKYLAVVPPGKSEKDAKISQHQFIEGLKDESKPVYEKTALKLQK